MPHMIMVSFQSFLASLGATNETYLTVDHVPEYIQTRLWSKFKDLSNLPPCVPDNVERPFTKAEISKFCRLFLPEACITMVGYNLSYSDQVSVYFSHKGQLFTNPSRKRMNNPLIVVPPDFDLFVCKCFLCKLRPLCTKALVCEECIPLMVTGGADQLSVQLSPLKKNNRSRGRFLSEIMQRFDTQVPVISDYSMSLRDALESTVKHIVKRKEIVEMLESYLARLNADLLATGEIKAKPKTIKQTGNNSRHFDWDIKPEYQHLYPTLKEQKQTQHFIYIPPAHRVAKQFDHTPLFLQIRDIKGVSLAEKTELYMWLDQGKEKQVLQALVQYRIRKTVDQILEDYEGPDLTELRNKKIPGQDMSFLYDKKELTVEEKRQDAAFANAYNRIDWSALEQIAKEEDYEDEGYSFSVADI